MWIFPVGNYLDIHKTGSVAPTLSKPCLQLLDIYQTFQHPSLLSSRTVANQTCIALSLPAPVMLQTQLSQRLLRQFLLIYNCWDVAESLASSLHICQGDLNIHIVKAVNAGWWALTECSEQSEQNIDVSLCWQILSLNDLVVHWWAILRFLQEHTPLQFSDILLMFLWTQREFFHPTLVIPVASWGWDHFC